VFFLLFVQSNSQSNVKSVIGIETNTDFIDNTIFLQPDSLNQIKLSSISNKSFHILQLDGIPLFSLFDGQYNYTFLKNFNLKNTGLNFNTIKLSKPLTKDSLSADVILFSSNYNGLLQANIFKKKNSLYFRLNSSFESSGGYYYSNRTKENVVDLRFLENSAYQNIGIALSTGFLNNTSDISLNLLYNKSKLNVPIKLNDKSKFKQQFNVYDALLGYMKFENKFNDKIHLWGNFFFRKFVRDYGSSYDSTYIMFRQFNSKLEIDEYNYGGNLFMNYNLINPENPTFLHFNYSQNIFLFSNESDQDRVRTESENLSILLEQKVLLSENFDAVIGAKLNSRAILYTEFGEIPENKSILDYHANLNYHLEDSSMISFKYEKYSIFPLVGNYFELRPNQYENIELKSERWNDFSLSYSTNLFDIFNTKITAQYSQGSNINYPLFIDTTHYKFSSDGNLKAFGGIFELKFEVFDVAFSSITRFSLQDFSEEKLKIVQAYRLPVFSEELMLSKEFDFGLSMNLKSNYRKGIKGFNFNEGRIRNFKDFFVMDLLINQKVFSENIFLAVRNLTNQYYEYNFLIPEPGINFLFGLSLSF
jgi:hypothetical protein